MPDTEAQDQLRKIIIFGLQRAAGPYSWAMNDLLHRSKFGEIRQGQICNWATRRRVRLSKEEQKLFDPAGTVIWDV
jgi:hypothetical protein